MQFAYKQILTSLLFNVCILSSQTSYAKDIQIEVNPIKSFLPSNPQQKKFGKLEFLSGAELSSDNEDFGGLSGIEWGDNNAHFIAISDKARFITGEIIYQNGRITKIENATLTRTRNAQGKIITGAEDKDAEALALHGKKIILGYERNDRIAFFAEKNKKLIQSKTSPAIDLNALEFPFNKGIEAITIAPKTKTLFAFTEHALDAEGNHRGYMIKNGDIKEIAIAVPNGYSITDAGFLDNGKLILLERYYSIFTGSAMRIRRFGTEDDIAESAILTGEVLFEANSQYEIDNMEGLSISKLQDGSQKLTLVSDDNFSESQRTLLLEFKLLD